VIDFTVIRRNGETFKVFVDSEDFDRVEAAGPWHVLPHSKTYYARRNVHLPSGIRTIEKLHHFILGMKGVDHIDGNGLNNCKANLRPATHAENMQNRHGLPSNNTSGYRGVCFHKWSGLWRAQIKLDGCHHHLGFYATAAEAGAAASNGRAKLMPFSSDARERTR